MPRSGSGGVRTSLDGNGYSDSYFDGLAYQQVTLHDARFLGGTVADQTITIWAKGVVSVGPPTSHQIGLMASYTGGDLSSIFAPGTYIAAAPSGAAYAEVTLEQTYSGGQVTGDVSVTWATGSTAAALIFDGTDGFTLTHSAGPGLLSQVHAGDLNYTETTQDPTSASFEDASFHVVTDNSLEATLTASGTIPSTLVGQGDDQGAGNTFNGNSAGIATDMIGGAGADTFNIVGPGNIAGGGGGDAFLISGAGANVIGGSGGDTFEATVGGNRLTGGGGADEFDLGSSSNTIVYQSSSDSTLGARDIIHGSDVAIDLTALTVSDIMIYHGTNQDIVDFMTTTGDLSIIVDSVSDINVMGNFDIVGTSASDSINANYFAGLVVNGNFVIDGGAGDDVIDASQFSTATITGGAGSDTLYAAAATTFLYNSIDDSSPDAGSVDTIVSFKSGSDTVDLSALDATSFAIRHGPAGDVLTVGTGSDTMVIDFTGSSLSPDDILLGGLTRHAAPGQDILYGSAGPDTLYAAAAHNTLSGGTATNTASDGTVVSLDGTFITPVSNVSYTAGSGTTVISGQLTLDQINDGGVSYSFSTPAAGEAFSLSFLASGAGVSAVVFDPHGNSVDLTGADTILLGDPGTYTINVEQSFSAGYQQDADFGSYQIAVTVQGALLATATEVAGTQVIGGAGDDILYGGSGSDILYGGMGNDIYYVTSTNDSVVEAPNAGIDTVDASFSYTLRDNVENLVLTGTADSNGVGNALNNVITGNSGNNVLNGMAGADMMVGGAGNDIYFVDNIHDIVTEAANAGIDTVRSTITYTLGDNVENLLLIGIANSNGIGNALNNVITGNSGNNVLNGMAGADIMAGGSGNDTYFVDNVGDVVTEAANAGTDTVRSTITYTLGDNVENLMLIGIANSNGIGNALNNVITGNSGNNVLNGMAGADTMAGGSGNDTYFVDNAGDVVTEAANAGIDTVRATITYTLGDNFENLMLIGAGAINGTGNSLANQIIGNSGGNIITGGAGADTITGGAGADTFVYLTSSDSTKLATDLITDFQTGIDKIDLSRLHTSSADTFSITSSGGFTYVSVDLGGNGSVDTLIQATGNNVISTSDIIWSKTSSIAPGHTTGNFGSVNDIPEHNHHVGLNGLSHGTSEDHFVF